MFHADRMIGTEIMKTDSILVPADYKFSISNRTVFKKYDGEE